MTGIKENDKQLIKDGAKKLGKTAAVSIIAVGVIDIVDGPDGMDTPETT
ncbi:hypothetical protein H8B09_21945 [Paenibacillus sp. PR3]|uniref:Uncharacterized protein n=1 Tax=Paenibacillus terricola TaxID=2763503 RepID=A0ABR8MZT0_9BACL|nr:hypothetical protein [Paenibacillus terricola]MBD3921446.1 hypothetical protein [Paenibacillus terricola]